jgi:hypothetical protein
VGAGWCAVLRAMGYSALSERDVRKCYRQCSVKRRTHPLICTSAYWRNTVLSNASCAWYALASISCVRRSPVTRRCFSAIWALRYLAEGRALVLSSVGGCSAGVVRVLVLF